MRILRVLRRSLTFTVPCDAFAQGLVRIVRLVRVLRLIRELRPWILSMSTYASSQDLGAVYRLDDDLIVVDRGLATALVGASRAWCSHVKPLKRC